MIQAIDASSARRRQHRQRQTEPARRIPPVLRQPADQDRDEHEIVDAEHDLERGQRHETCPDLRIGQPLHQACFDSWYRDKKVATR